MASAGKVSPITRGVWDSTASYTRLDIVTNSQNTKSYICKKDNTNTPLENTEFWQVLVNIGDASGIEYDNTTSGMTATNVKEALDELASKEIELDDAMSDTSENAVQNKVIKEYVDDNVSQLADDALNIKKLGWTVPSQLAVKNYIGTDGKFHKKIGRVDLGSLDYIYKNNIYFWTNLNKIGIKPRVANAIYCSRYKITDASFDGAQEDKTMKMSDDNLLITDRAYTNTSSLKVALQGVYLYYELATEEVLELDGQEAGYFAKKNVTTNLLKPTLQSTTLNGVTCTDNGNGTFTLNGTANANTNFFLMANSQYETLLAKNAGKRIKLVGCKDGSHDTFRLASWLNNVGNFIDYGDGAVINIPSNFNDAANINITVISGTVCNNVTIKPMLTTDLDATYDDFVPYTGDTGTINGDVAEIKRNIVTVNIHIPTANNWAYADLPLGFKFDNCVVVSAMRIDPTEYTVWGGGHSGTYEQQLIRLFNDGRIGCLSSIASNITIKIVLLKLT